MKHPDLADFYLRIASKDLTPTKDEWIRVQRNLKHDHAPATLITPQDLHKSSAKLRSAVRGLYRRLQPPKISRVTTYKVVLPTQVKHAKPSFAKVSHYITHKAYLPLVEEMIIPYRQKYNELLEEHLRLVNHFRLYSRDYQLRTGNYQFGFDLSYDRPNGKRLRLERIDIRKFLDYFEKEANGGE